MKNKGVLVVVLLTVVLIGIILLSQNSSVERIISTRSISGNSITGKAITGQTFLDLFKPKQGVSVYSGKNLMKLTMLNLPNKIKVGEEFTVNMKLELPYAAYIFSSPLVAVVADGLEIKSADYGVFEENSDTILWYFLPNYKNINFSVYAPSEGIKTITTTFWTFNPAEKGTLTTSLTVEGAREDYGNCKFTDNFDNFNLKNYVNQTIKPVFVNNSKLVLGLAGWDYLFENMIYQRETGLTYQVKVKPGAVYTYVGWMNGDATTVSYTNFVHSIWFLYNTYVVSYESGVPVYLKYTNNSYITFNPKREYDVKIVLRGNGADYYLKPIDSTSWTKIYSSMKSYSKNNLVPGIVGYYGLAPYAAVNIDDWVTGTENCAVSTSPPAVPLCSTIAECNDNNPSTRDECVNPGTSAAYCTHSACTLTSCTALGKNCGSWDNGCGGTLNCGSCSFGNTCSNGVCSCGGRICQAPQVCSAGQCVANPCETMSCQPGWHCEVSTTGTGECVQG